MCHFELGHRGRHKPAKCTMGAYAPPLVWALGTLTARVRCPLGIGNRAKHLNSIKIDGLKPGHDPFGGHSDCHNLL